MPKLGGLAFESIDIPSVNWLERPFENSEMHHVVRGMARDNPWVG